MKKERNIKSHSKQQNRMIEKALTTGGFLFPQTIEEVKEFERIYGTTDIIMPAELQEPTFLYSNSKRKNGSIALKLHSKNFAMAAREGSNQLPKEIQQQIIEDIKANQPKRKKRKS